MTSTPSPAATFAALNLPDQIAAALARMNYDTPTPIQSQAIPAAIAGRDLLASAQTGTGKTAAFSIPMIARLMADPSATALVLAPTRELASQTLDVVNKLTANNRDMRTALLIGGEPMGKQFDQLRRDPRIIIGTPGRINDHLRRNSKMLAMVNFIALDEADRMLDMGFSVQIDEIFKLVRKDRQMVMFSATFPDSIVKFARNYLKDPVRVSVSPEQVSAPNIKHDMVRTTDGEKYTKLLAELETREGSVIIFVKTQHGTDRLATRLTKDGHDGIAIHGGLRQNQRDKAVRAFRQQRVRILVATDVASRGLDIPHIEHVINYDLPQVAEDYIHRIGRTARAGAEGNAMCFVTPADGGKWHAIHRILNPGAAPEHAPRGGDRSSNARPNRGGGGGAPRRDDRSGSSFGKKPYVKKEWSNDRNDRSDRFERPARADRAERDSRHLAAPKRFANTQKPADRAPSDRNWNTKDDRAPYKPAGEKPQWRNEGRSTGEGRGDGRMGNDRSNKPQARRDDRVPAGGDFKRDHRASGSQGGYEGRKAADERHFSKPAFKKDDRGDARTDSRAAPRKPKPAKADAVKKPFKFKEHSRKPGRPGGDKASAAV